MKVGSRCSPYDDEDDEENESQLETESIEDGGEGYGNVFLRRGKCFDMFESSIRSRE